MQRLLGEARVISMGHWRASLWTVSRQPIDMVALSRSPRRGLGSLSRPWKEDQSLRAKYIRAVHDLVHVELVRLARWKEPHSIQKWIKGTYIAHQPVSRSQARIPIPRPPPLLPRPQPYRKLLGPVEAQALPYIASTYHSRRDVSGGQRDMGSHSSSTYRRNSG